MKIFNIIFFLTVIILFNPNAFGQTETASTITMLSPEDHEITGTPEEQEIKLQRLSSIGKPLDDVIVQIVDEEGKEVIQGDVGEIVAQGPRLMKGYWNKEDATNETIRDGWLYTGDLGYMDSEGYIFITDWGNFHFMLIIFIFAHINSFNCYFRNISINIFFIFYTTCHSFFFCPQTRWFVQSKITFPYTSINKTI